VRRIIQTVISQITSAKNGAVKDESFACFDRMRRTRRARIRANCNDDASGVSSHGSEMQNCIKSNLDLNKFSASCATEFKNAAAAKKPGS